MAKQVVLESAVHKRVSVLAAQRDESIQNLVNLMLAKSLDAADKAQLRKKGK
jgi:hypothetical protein